MEEETVNMPCSSLRFSSVGLSWPEHDEVVLLLWGALGLPGLQGVGMQAGGCALL